MEEKNPWMTIWTKPKETIRKIVASKPKKGFWILSAIFGLSFLLSNAFMLSLKSGVSLPMGIVAAIVLAPFIGALALTIGAWILYGVGKWFGGKAPYKNVLSAYSWSKAPTLIIVVVWLLLLIFAGRDNIVNLLSGNSFFFFTIINLIAQIWALVLLLLTLQEVQEYSLWRAFGNWAVSVILYMAVIFFISFIIGSMVASG